MSSHLTTGIRSEKRVVRRFRRCANVIECFRFFAHSYRAFCSYKIFIYSPTDALVRVFRNNIKVYIKIIALPDDGVTVTPKHVGAVLM